MDPPRFFPPSLLDQSFGLCISPQDFIFPSYNFHRTNYYRPWKWYQQSAEKDFGSMIHNEKDKFKICLDVQHFEPSEINVRVADREIIIEGKHEEKEDNHGFISRQFKRRYFLPIDCSAESVVSTLSSDGVLIVTADKIKELKSKEIMVPIKSSGTSLNKAKIEQNKKEVKEKTEDKNNVYNEPRKKGMEIMLKEDHCCLLKPELLGTACATSSLKISMDTKKEADDLLKTTCQASATTSTTTKSELITAGETSAAATVAKSQLKSIDKTSASTSISTKSELETAGETSSTKYATKTTGETSAFTSTAGKKDTDDLLKTICEASGSLSTAAKSELKTTGETLAATSTGAITEKVDSASLSTHTLSTTEKGKVSMAAKSEMCNKIESSVQESITIQESSTSTLPASIKETGERISEIVSDISAQLKEAAESI